MMDLAVSTSILAARLILLFKGLPAVLAWATWAEKDSFINHQQLDMAQIEKNIDVYIQ